MRFKHLLLFGALALTCTQAMAEIVNGVRQRPEPQTTAFVADQEFYMYNVGSGTFFTQGNSWMTQASVGSTPRKVKFQLDGNDYTMLCYCWRGSGDPGGKMSEDWRNVFFDSETALFVDRYQQANYFFAIEDNGATYRLSTGSKNPTFSDYYGSGLYVGLKKNSSETVLSPFVDENEAYVDWAFVTIEDFEALAPALIIYEKAQQLKMWIDKIVAQNGDASSLSTVYLNEDATMEELQAAIDSAQPIYIQALINNAPDKENVDVTMALVNPDFEQDETGWTVVATPGSGANGHAGNVRPGGSATNHCYEAWNNSSFDIYQSLTGMPVGVYEIEVQGFYRYGRGDNAWNAYLAQNVDYVKPEGVPVYIYLNNSQTNFVNVFGDPKQITNESFYSVGSSDYSSQSNGTTYYFPNGMASAAIAFSNNMYTQSAFGLIAKEGDQFRIGVKGNSSQLGDSWCIWDNFKLYYRGFKPEVVKPVLEKAVADINIYAGLPMGKSVYALMNSALAAAQQAIDQNDGTAMFNALNALYDAKSTIQASKDLFAENGVAEKITSLEEAIAGVAESKLSQATLTAANTLLTALKNNTFYENETVTNIASDVASQIGALTTSVSLYAELKTAIDGLAEYSEAKAYTSLLTQAATLKTSATTAYNDGTIADANVPEKVAEINTLKNQIVASMESYVSLKKSLDEELQPVLANKCNADTLTKAQTLYDADLQKWTEGSIADEDIDAEIKEIKARVASVTNSTALYVQLNEAIGRLEEAVAEASAESTRIAQSTLKKGNLRLTVSKKLYDEGTIADADIPARITSIDQLIEELTRSINLYKDFAAGLASLKTALETEDKVAAATLEAAQQLYTNANKDYEEGNTDDDAIEAMIAQLTAAVTNLKNSAELYKNYAVAIAGLKTAIDKEEKVAASVLAAAQQLYTTNNTAYTAGSTTDGEVDAAIAQLNDAVASLTNSAAQYKKLAEAIPTLEEAVAKKAMKTLLDDANSLLTTLQEGYAAGSIADEDIDGYVTSINEKAAAITASAEEYAKLKAAIDRLTAAIEEASAETEHVAQSTLKKANLRLTVSQKHYNEGTIADADIADRITVIDQLIEELTGSIRLYKDFAAAIANLKTAIDGMEGKKLAAATLTAANQLYTTAETAYNEGTIDDDQVAAQVSTLNNMITTLNASVTAYTNLKSAIDALDAVKTAKAAKAVLDEAAALVAATTTAYNEGSIADADVAAKITELENKLAEVNASAAKYADYAKAIANLKTAIEGVNNKKLSSATRTAALTLSNTLDAAYAAGTMTDAQAEDATNMIATVNASVAAYANLKTAIDALDAVKTAKAAKAVLDDAAALVAATTTAYNEGSIADANVSAKITELENKLAEVNASAEKYAAYATAIANLKTAIEGVNNKKLSSATRTAALTLSNTLDAAYAAGTMTDAQAEDATNMIATVNASVAAYANLKTAIDALDAVKTAKAAKAVLDDAAALVAATTTAYNEGSIADANVSAKITELENKLADVNASVEIYATYAAAIANLKTALEGTNNKKLSAATRSAAQTLTNTLDAAYAAGTMTDQQAGEATAMIATLDSSVEVYATLKTALDDLLAKITEAENSNKVMADLLTEAQTLLESESKKYNDGSLTDNDVPASVEAIRNMISKLQEAIDSTATRINAVSTATDADNTYTMGGRKVVGKQKGLVIRNGRKVVVK